MGGRYANCKTPHEDPVDAQWRAEELLPPEQMEAEVAGPEHGLAHAQMVGIETQTSAGDLKSVNHGNFEPLQFDAAVEPGAEGLDEFGLDHGVGAVQQDFAGDEERSEDRQPGQADDEQHAPERGAGVNRRRLRLSGMRAVGQRPGPFINWQKLR